MEKIHLPPNGMIHFSVMVYDVYFSIKTRGNDGSHWNHPFPPKAFMLLLLKNDEAKHRNKKKKNKSAIFKTLGKLKYPN